MIGGRAAFILLNFSFSVIQTLDVPRIPLTEVGLGDTVTLTCEIHGIERGLFYWYKMNYGYRVQTVVKATFDRVNLEGEFKSSRFRVIKVGDVYSLTITNVCKDDEATYLCQAGAAYTMVFVNVSHLHVNQNDLNKQEKTSSDMESNQQDLVTLQCSVISEGRDNSDQCSGRRCINQRSKATQDSVGPRAVYCAEATCGEILFGGGSQTQINWDPVVVGLGVLLGLSVIVIAVLVFSRD